MLIINIKLNKYEILKIKNNIYPSSYYVLLKFVELPNEKASMKRYTN